MRRVVYKFCVPGSHTAQEVIEKAADRDRLLRASDLGVPAEAMARMQKAGVVDRVAPGVYIGASRKRSPLAEAAAWSLRYPGAVACLLTAAVHHRLTDAFARGTWLFVAKRTSVPRSRHARLQVVQIAPRFIDAGLDPENGIISVKVHGTTLRITGPDRTAIDLWRYPRRIAQEHALEALRRRSRADDFKLPSFARLARRLGAWPRLEPVLQGMMLR
jgi:hypothetical protein